MAEGLQPRDVAASSLNELANKTNGLPLDVNTHVAIAQVHALLHIGDAIDRLGDAVFRASGRGPR